MTGHQDKEFYWIWLIGLRDKISHKKNHSAVKGQTLGLTCRISHGHFFYGFLLGHTRQTKRKRDYSQSMNPGTFVIFFKLKNAS